MTTRHDYIVLPTSSEPREDVNEDADPILESLLREIKGVTLDTPHGGSLAIHEDGHTYNYSYGPSGIPGLLRNRYAVASAAFAGIGGISFGYDQGVISNVLVMKDFLTRWPIGPWEKGLMTAALELGALFGAITCGILTDKYCRRHSIFFASIIFCLGSGLQCGAQSLNDLIIGRAIGGFGVGALSMLSPLYMAEISPPELRGSLMALEQLAIVLGVVFGFWTGFLTRNIAGSASWRIPLALQFLPGISLCIGCFILPPSPRLLVLCGRIDDARKTLARLRLRTPDEAKEDPLIQLELLEMQINVALVREKSKDGLSRDTWTTLFGREYVRRTLIGIMIMFFQQWSGINALLYYGPTLVESIGMRGDTVTLLVSGGIGIVQFFAVFPAIVYLDRWGVANLFSKVLMFVLESPCNSRSKGGSAIMATSHFIIAILIHCFQDDWGSNTIAAWVAVFCTYIFTAAYGMSFGPIGWVLPSEVFPLSMRSKGVSLSTASNWINNFLIGLITPPLMEMSSAATFMIFACACFGAYLWSSYVVPETAGVSLEEMDAVFGSAAGQKDRKRKFELERELGLHDLIKGLVPSEALGQE